MKFRINKLFIFLAVLCLGVPSFAQSGAYTGYSPYSVFGIGDISDMGCAWNRTMGGVGIATRNRKVVNTLNPASVTARDSLSFMTDVSVLQSNTLVTQNGKNKVTNSANINDLVISFPVYKKSAMMFGIAPFSNSGYSFAGQTNPEVLPYTGVISQSSTGQGSMYQMFAAAGVTFWRKLSLGLEYIYYFGDSQKVNYLTFSDGSNKGVISGYDINMHAGAFKFGAQYEQKAGSLDLCVGATYKTRANIRGHVTDYSVSGSVVVDTLRYNVNDMRDGKGVKFASELGLGVSLRQSERWRAEINYLFSDWSDSGFDTTVGLSSVSTRTFTAKPAHSIRAGFEFTPNVNDIRYFYRRCTYRAGVYHNQMYYKFAGHDIAATGITLGVTLPVFRLSNGLTLGVDLGQKGTVSDNMIRERYVNFSISMNAFDLWFQKPRYN